MRNETGLLFNFARRTPLPVYNCAQPPFSDVCVFASDFDSEAVTGRFRKVQGEGKRSRSVPLLALSPRCALDPVKEEKTAAFFHFFDVFFFELWEIKVFAKSALSQKLGGKTQKAAFLKCIIKPLCGSPVCVGVWRNVIIY